MPFITFEVKCEKCGQDFCDASYSVGIGDLFILSKLQMYRRLGDAHWLCNRCLEATGGIQGQKGIAGPTDARQASHGIQQGSVQGSKEMP